VEHEQGGGADSDRIAVEDAGAISFEPAEQDEGLDGAI
jgi:hypothetical protein